tara:strand:+ start:1759 stop:2511 length:753 start_codon:yes stop_codon:yes gene_type:complete
MAVKVSKLWSNNNFLKLTNGSKLLYIYLATNPSIMMTGVLNVNLEMLTVQLNLSLKEIRESTQELVKSKFVSVKKIDNLYFIVKAHFDSVPKSDTSVLKLNKELESLPNSLVKFLESINVSSSRKVVTFSEPTPAEVMDYSLSQGYQVNAEAFIGFYRGKALAHGKVGLWLDGRGKQVKDWKAKLRVVWFKDENKIKVVAGAPKGFESFYIDFEGKQVFPESWKDGKPYSKNIAVLIALKKEYERRKTNS